MVQRLLSARSLAQSRLALYASWVVIFFQFTLFLVIGVILWAYYQHTGLPPPAQTDRIYPAFIWEQLPPGIAGLVIAAILAAAMSNLSAALNSLASTTVMDFYRPMSSSTRSDAGWLRIARITTLFWGTVLIGVAWVARQWGSVLEAGLSIASVVYGSLLGVFLLGVLTSRVQERAAMAGMVAGLLTMLYVKTQTQIAWTWYVLIGTSVTFLVAWLMSLIFREEAHS
jgi:solute:Na+ symporter, SSS family